MASIEAAAYAAAKENGMQVYELSPAELQAWKTAAQPVYQSFLDSAGPEGAALLEAAEKLSATQ